MSDSDWRRWVIIIILFVEKKEQPVCQIRKSIGISGQRLEQILYVSDNCHVLKEITTSEKKRRAFAARQLHAACRWPCPIDGRLPDHLGVTQRPSASTTRKFRSAKDLRLLERARSSRASGAGAELSLPAAYPWVTPWETAEISEYSERGTRGRANDECAKRKTKNSLPPGSFNVFVKSIVSIFATSASSTGFCCGMRKNLRPLDLAIVIGMPEPPINDS